MVALFFGLAAFVIWQLGTAVYVITQALVGQAMGTRTREISVGFGPRLAEWTLGKGVVFRIGLFPWGGYTRFLGTLNADDEDYDEMSSDVWEPIGEEGLSTKPFRELSPWRKMLVVCSGPISAIVLGLCFMSPAVLSESRQLTVVPAQQSEVFPCAVGGLRWIDSPTTWEGQFQLFHETAGEFCWRLVTFESLEDWGGYFGFFVTCGSLGELSVDAWITSLGIILLFNGLANLLPIPCLNGCHLLFFLYEALIGKPLGLKIRTVATWFGLIFLLILMGRVCYVDFCWLWSLIFG
jgi:membrane-associated protease RseP (regulator of RpoE activity)